MHAPFSQRRRQVFVQANYFEVLQAHYASSRDFWATNSPEADSLAQAKSLAASSVAEDGYRLLSLRYTAGEPIEPLRNELAEVIEAYERYQNALAEYEQIPEVAPLGMGNIGDYERCMQLIGLCYLLHRRDLLPRIAALQDPAYVNSDALYEDLLRYGLSDRPETDEMLHLEAYAPLLGAIWAPSDAEASALLKQYVDGWYPHFKYVPWHDGHMRIDGTDGDYFGYWAFEAGAVALLCEVDDTAIDHMVYPKDLVAWARQNAHLSELSNGADAANQLRCEAGQPCPMAGFWFTPARAGSRQHFEQGQVMPDVGGDYGATIWQWDVQQAS